MFMPHGGIDDEEYSQYFINYAVDLAKITCYLINEEFVPHLHSLNKDFMKLNKQFLQVLEGQPTFFKETM